MKAMVLREFGSPLQLEELPEPGVGPAEVLVRVRACGVCGTDVKVWSGRFPGVELPLVMGHEPAGEVAAVGPGTEGVRVGDRVVCLSSIPCGSCEACQADRPNLCMASRVGFTRPGGFAEFLRVPASICVPAPANVDFPGAAAIVGAASAPYHALRTRACLQPGERVVVLGAGGLGLHAVQIARALGADVVAADLHAPRVELACSLGARAGLVFGGPRFVEGIRELFGGRSPDVVVDTVGAAPTVQAAWELLRRGGRLVLVGYDSQSELRAPTARLVLDEIAVVGSRSITRQEMEELVRLVELGQVRPVVGGVYPLSQLNRALADLRDGRVVGRAVVVMD